MPPAKGENWYAAEFIIMVLFCGETGDFLISFVVAEGPRLVSFVTSTYSLGMKDFRRDKINQSNHLKSFECQAAPD
jgi:hypothetical protein